MITTMMAAFLVPEQTVSKNGEGPAVEIGGGPRGLVEVTLGILEVIEQQSLDVNIHGSADGAAWSPKPLAAFPQKFYTGTTKIVIDLERHADVNLLRVQWKVNRWGNWKEPPLFRFYVFAAPAE